MTMHLPLGKPQPWVLPMTFVCLALGALVASMFRIASAPKPGDIDPASARPEELVAKIRTMQAEKLAMKEEILDLREDKDRLIDEKKASDTVKKELDSLRIRAGSTSVEGRGVVITIDDTKNTQPDLAKINENLALAHDVDLLMLVNELRIARAEAISINDQRIVFSSAIRCTGPTILVNDTPIAVPFIIKAIGNPDTLMGAVNMPHGVLDQLKLLGIQVSVVKRDKLRLPPISVLPPFRESRVGEAEPSSNRP